MRRRFSFAGMSLALREYHGAKLLKPQDLGLRPLLDASSKTSSRRRILSQVPLSFRSGRSIPMNGYSHASRKLLVSVPLIPLAATAALIATFLRCTCSMQSQASSNVLYDRDMGRPVLERAQGNIISSKPFIAHSTEASTQRGLLAHELIQGPLVRPLRTAIMRSDVPDLLQFDVLGRSPRQRHSSHVQAQEVASAAEPARW